MLTDDTWQDGGLSSSASIAVIIDGDSDFAADAASVLSKRRFRTAAWYLSVSFSQIGATYDRKHANQNTAIVFCNQPSLSHRVKRVRTELDLV